MVTEIKKIAVVGSGTMGSGIAQTFASAGYQVSLIDIKQEYLDKALAKIDKMLSRNVEKGRLTPKEKEQIINNISTTLDLEEGVKDVQLVVEAVIENEDLKKDIFGKLDKYCEPNTILASNTSAISITVLASVTNRPDKVLGMHFFNPPPVMKLVEIIKGEKTSDETIDLVTNVCKKLNKVPVPSNEAPGFIVNRLLWPFLNEAYQLLEEGVATKEGIDQAVKLGLNHPMGPFELSDYIGLDVMLDIGNYLYSKLGEKYKPKEILRKLVDDGKLGRKSGEGFYKY